MFQDEFEVHRAMKQPSLSSHMHTHRQAGTKRAHTHKGTQKAPYMRANLRCPALALRMRVCTYVCFCACCRLC